MMTLSYQDGSGNGGGVRSRSKSAFGRVPRPPLGALLVTSMLACASVAACGGDEETDGPTGTGGAGGLGGNGPIASGGVDGNSGGAATGGTDVGTGGAYSGIVGGGLQLEVLKVAVSDAGVATVEFTIADDDGRPLDREGKQTFGAVSPSFILSWLGENDKGESTQYTAYTLRTKETSDGASEVQSSTDTGGSYETLGIGHYRYTLGTEIDITAERRGLTHSLGVYATREVSGVRFVATDVESWVPDGSEVSTVLDVVTTAACNECHTRLEFHGGSRRGVDMCQLCHTESNSINPESGNTIDFQVMVHKIHMGGALPSVVAGDPYFFVGYGGHTIDYSDVGYPWQMTDCGKCHQGSQGDRWNTRPAMKACTSCHDRTYFGSGEPPEGWTAHTAGPRDDSECIVCHAADSLEPITKRHTTSITDENRPVVAAEILGIESTAPGETPEIEFEVTIDGTPVDILAERPNRLRLRIWGPTSDVNRAWAETIEDAGNSVAAVECDGSFTPPCVESLGDAFVFHAATPIPADAKGSYIAGLDGRYAIVDYGNIAFVNPSLTFAVTSELTERREIVSRETCNGCHGDLGFHGGGYKDPLYCLNCHNTTATFGVDEPPAPGETTVGGSMNLKDFLHSTHASVRYPSPLNACEQCHLPDTYTLPLAPGLLPSTYTSVSCPEGATDCAEGMGGGSAVPETTTSTLGPAAAACVSCHSDPTAVAHAQTNTAAAGEACATCHGAGKTYDVAVVHRLAP